MFITTTTPRTTTTTITTTTTTTTTTDNHHHSHYSNTTTTTTNKQHPQQQHCTTPPSPPQHHHHRHSNNNNNNTTTTIIIPYPTNQKINEYNHTNNAPRVESHSFCACIAFIILNTNTNPNFETKGVNITTNTACADGGVVTPNQIVDDTVDDFASACLLSHLFPNTKRPSSATQSTHSAYSPSPSRIIAFTITVTFTCIITITLTTILIHMGYLGYHNRCNIESPTTNANTDAEFDSV